LSLQGLGLGDCLAAALIERAKVAEDFGGIQTTVSQHFFDFKQVFADEDKVKHRNI
jgi:hypothetical protein